jgi:hypothetical protein
MFNSRLVAHIREGDQEGSPSRCRPEGTPGGVFALPPTLRRGVGERSERSSRLCSRVRNERGAGEQWKHEADGASFHRREPRVPHAGGSRSQKGDSRLGDEIDPRRTLVRGRSHSSLGSSLRTNSSSDERGSFAGSHVRERAVGLARVQSDAASALRSRARSAGSKVWRSCHDLDPRRARRRGDVVAALANPLLSRNDAVAPPPSVG